MSGVLPRTCGDAVQPALNRALLLGWTIVDERIDGACLQHPRHLLQVIATAAYERDDRRWLHVSVVPRGQKRLPTWDELRLVKDHFIGRDATALQVLPPADQHVNIHEFCLHLWHCLDGDVTPDFSHGGRI